MPRCEQLNENDKNEIFSMKWDHTVAGIDVELKVDSFGRLNGTVVAVDYGSWYT